MSTSTAPMGHVRIPIFTAITTYFGYAVLIFFGHIRDFFSQVFSKVFGISKKQSNPNLPPLVNDFEDFYTRRLYHRIHDCWNRPIASSPSAWVSVLERTPIQYQKPLEFTGEVRRCLNLGSYNYLGFGDPNSPTKAFVLKALEDWGVSTCGLPSICGTTRVHKEAEKVVANFVGQDDAVIFPMGFGTNSTVMSSLVGKGCLILSDSHNHSSIAVGARSTGATIKVFRHNDLSNLEKLIRKSIIEGQPRLNRPWKKIMIIIEGIYSMEGEMSVLPEIIELKKRYKCYLYLDEAHSIGALGRTGRGVCEQKNVNPKDVDILMGTFTKSFGAVGGYIAATPDICNHIRATCLANLYHVGISLPACQQIISSIKIISGEDGTDLGRRKLDQLRENANFFRNKLRDLGCHVLGENDSPVVPLMLYNPAKIGAFSRECLKRNLAVVVVGFPATPLLLSRTRFCISAAHTIEDLEWAVSQIEEVCDILGLRYGRNLWGDLFSFSKSPKSLHP